ncbi:MAG: alpha/beta hydrolase [Actinomycetota bacterium]|nr:alpha/beta hydrolase [Actinomycetota bacterium]
MIAWHDFGGVGPDLLLAHATGFHAHVWLPVVAHLRDRFRCVAVDERGHGDSAGGPDVDLDWRAASHDLLEVIEAARLVRPFGAGHSAGAAQLLMAEQDAPGTFRALYCFEPVIPRVPAQPMASPLSEGARRRKEVFESRDEALARFREKFPFSLFALDALRAYVDHGFDDLPDGTVRLKCRREDEARTYEHGVAHDAFARLGEVRCPVAVECGTAPSPFGLDACEAYASRLPDARATALDGLSHFGPQERPDLIAGRIAAAFLDS